jgi:hypothetical protein
LPCCRWLTARHGSGDRWQAFHEGLAAAPFIEASPASETQVEDERRSLNRKVLQTPMMPVMPRCRRPATDRAGSFTSSTRRKDPAAVPQLDLCDFDSGPKGQFDFLSHAFLCTEGATLTISSPESDEDPAKMAPDMGFVERRAGPMDFF